MQMTQSVKFLISQYIKSLTTLSHYIENLKCSNLLHVLHIIRCFNK